MPYLNVYYVNNNKTAYVCEQAIVGKVIHSGVKCSTSKFVVNILSAVA